MTARPSLQLLRSFTGGGEDASSKEPENKGNLMLDVTCVPVVIQYSTDSRLLNDARGALEEIVYALHAPILECARNPEHPGKL